MKRLVTSMCVGILAMGAVARAATEPKPAHTLALPTLTISGQTAFNAWFYHNQRKIVEGDAANSPSKQRGYGSTPLFTMDDARLRFTTDGKTDAGMRYGFILVLDGDTSATKTLRENYVFLEGSWGKLLAGDTYGVLSTMAFGGWDNWCGTKFIDGNFDHVVNWTTGAFHSLNLVGDTNRDTKLTYLTPRWKGIQAGATFTPRAEHRGGEDTNTTTSLSSPKKPFDTNNISCGVNFIHKFVNDFEMALSATSAFAHANPEYPSSTLKRHNTRSFAMGASVAYQDIGLSGEYGNNGKSQQLSYINASNSAGQFADVGLSYKWGATKASAAYYYSWRNAMSGGTTTDLNKVKATVNAFDFAVDHKTAPGMIVYMEYANILMKNPAAVSEANRMTALYGATGGSGQYVGPTTNNRSNVFIVGSRLVF